MYVVGKQCGLARSRALPSGHDNSRAARRIPRECRDTACRRKVCAALRALCARALSAKRSGGGRLTFGLPPSRLGRMQARLLLLSLLRRFAAAYSPAARRRACSLKTVYVGERWHIALKFAAKIRNFPQNCSISPHLFIYIKAKRAKMPGKSTQNSDSSTIFHERHGNLRKNG